MIEIDSVHCFVAKLYQGRCMPIIILVLNNCYLDFWGGGVYLSAILRGVYGV